MASHGRSDTHTRKWPQRGQCETERAPQNSVTGMLPLTLRGRPIANVQAVETRSAPTYPPERPLSGYSIRSTNDGSWPGRAAGGCHRRPLARHDPISVTCECPVCSIRMQQQSAWRGRQLILQET
jgi:hypothetical protein